jgi:ATP-binding cassette subfamily C protein LapB
MMSLDEENVKSSDLIDYAQLFLSLHDIIMTRISIIETSECGDEIFDSSHFVNLLDYLGFSASFGRIGFKKLKKSMCPFVAFDSSSRPLLVVDVVDQGHWLVKVCGEEHPKVIERSQVKLDFSGYALIASIPSGGSESDNTRWFWNAFKSSKSLYFNVMLGTVFSNLLALSSAIFIMVVYDRVVPNSAIESLIALTIGVLLALTFEYVINILNARFTDLASMRADNKVARAIFDRLLRLRLDSNNYSVGRLSGIVKEFDTLREFFTSATLIAVVNIPFVFLFIWVISLICGPLAAVPLASVCTIIFIGVILQPFLGRLAKVSMESSFSKQSVLIETLSGLETVRATGSGNLLKKRFEKAADDQAKSGLKTRLSSQLGINLTQSIIKLNMIGTVVYGVFLIETGLVSMGSMFAAVLLGSRALSPLSSLTAAMSRASSARQSFKAISQLLTDDTITHTTSRSQLSRPKLNGEIEFKDVSFCFEGSSTPALDSVSLKIKSGQKIAILGGMGSGKSTLIRLLSGLVAPTSGSILLDGIDIRQIAEHDLRNNVGVMLQNTWLFSGTIRENIRMGFYQHKDDRILEVSQISTADDFISRTSMGYDLKLTENGTGLSGGQRQTINLARALIHDPNVLILDEPTSSMDKTSEKKVVENLQRWARNKTVVFVTHREELIRIADRVLILKDGKVVSDTSPARLAPRSLKTV